MTSYGQTHCTNLNSAAGDPALAATYYDMIRVAYQVADYTGKSSWNSCALRARTIYRDGYVMPNNAGVPGYWNFTTGLRMDFTRTGDAVSKTAAILLSQTAAYAADTTPLAWTVPADLSREVAYAISSYVNAELLGQPRRARRGQLVDQAYGHMNQWFVDMAWQGPNRTLKQFSPFMVGLTAHGLIRDWEQTEDPRLLPTLRMAADWLWANAWIPNERSMFYDALNGGTGPGQGAPDLNLLIAPMYAFLYAQTGETKYRDRGDALFAGGVDLAWLAGAKQFNQNYWWSFDYVKWRTAGTGVPPTTPPPTTPPPSNPPSSVDNTSPAIGITSPSAGATVSGSAAVGVSASDNVSVTSLKYYVDDALMAVVAPPTPNWTWDTTSLSNGPHTLKVVAADAAGNNGQASVSVNVANLSDTSTIISAPAVTYDTNAVVTVTVGSAQGTPGGTVSLSVDNAAPMTAALQNGQAQFTVSHPAPGDHALRASYAAQNSFAASSAKGSLHVDPAPPSETDPVFFSSATYSGRAVKSQVPITVLLSGPADEPVSVHYATSDGTARAGLNYRAASGTLKFRPGVTKQVFWVQTYKSRDTSPKTVNLQLSRPTGGALLGAPSSAVLVMGGVTPPRGSGTGVTVNGLVAAYNFNEGSGGTVNDESGNDNDGVIQGATWTAQGRFGAALAFDGTSDRVVIKSSPSLNLTSAMTLEAWVRPTSTTPRWQDVIFKDRDMYYLEASSPRGTPGAGGTFASAPTYGTFALPVDAWSHLAATYDRRTVRLYVNGVLVTSQPQTAPIAVSDSPLTIGGDQSFGQYFQGLIDEMRVYNRALSASEIQEDMNNPL